MAHPYASKMQGAERAKALTKASGGGIDWSTGSPATPFTKKVEPGVGGGPSAPKEYYGTSGEPRIGQRLEGPARSNGNKVPRTIYPDSPEGRKSMRRTRDKLDNEYGAYRYHPKPVSDE